MSIYLLSVLAGLATCLGCMIVLAFGKPNKKSLSLFMGMASGIMLAVIVFDLIPSSLAYGSLLETILGFFLGVLLMLFLDNFIAQIYSGTTSLSGKYLKMGYLIATGIALHDLPEGIAIAAGFTAKDNLGILIALAIGLHNIPEGMATAAPLKMGGLGNRQIIMIILLVSLFTPIGTLLGFLLVHFSHGLIATLLALAAGAMSYIIKNELLPESRRGNFGYATLGGLSGFGVIIWLTYIH